MARAHEAVLEAALVDHDVVPFRMCTVYASQDAIRAMLAAEAGRFEEALARLRGKTEWGVKAFAVPRRDAPAPQRPSSGKEYLARRIAQREHESSSRDSLERTAAELHARLADSASAAVLARPQDRRLSGRDDEMVLNGAYLVARDEAADFARLVEALGRRQSLALEITGPWPPYHFSDVRG
jgi:hypothetical protein